MEVDSTREGKRVKFRNIGEPWRYGRFIGLVAGGTEDEAVDVDGQDKIYLCRDEQGVQGRYSECKAAIEYRAYPALNSTSLMRFADCPAAVLMDMPARSYFEHGKIFESLAREIWSGEWGFWDKYFVCDAAGNIPEKLITLLAGGEDLAEAYIKTKKGERSETYRNLHFWLDECQKQPGKWPIGQDEFKMIKSMIHNLGQAEVLPGVAVAELLANGAEWQVPCIWESDGIVKKCLFDTVGALDDGRRVFMDLKALASAGKFSGDYRARYWVQDRHYSEGAWNLWGADGIYQDAMIFAVASKEAPHKGKCWEMGQEYRGAQHEAYASLCARFVEWEQQGRPSVAWEDKGILTWGGR